MAGATLHYVKPLVNAAVTTGLLLDGNVAKPMFHTTSSLELYQSHSSRYLYLQYDTRDDRYNSFKDVT